MADYTIRHGGKLVVGRVRLAGKVCGPVEFVVGVRQAACIPVDVSGEVYRVMTKPGKRLQGIELGTPVVVVGRMVRNVVWAEKGRFVTTGPQITPGVVEL